PDWLLLANRVDDAFGHVLRMSAARVDAKLRVRVRRLPYRKEPLELLAIARERTATVRRDARQQLVKRHVEPDRQSVQVDGRAILGIHERPAARRDDDVSKRQQQTDDIAFHAAEVWLTVPGEDISNRAAFARLDQLVDVFGPPSQPGRQG